MSDKAQDESEVQALNQVNQALSEDQIISEEAAAKIETTTQNSSLLWKE